MHLYYNYTIVSCKIYAEEYVFTSLVLVYHNFSCWTFALQHLPWPAFSRNKTKPLRRKNKNWGTYICKENVKKKCTPTEVTKLQTAHLTERAPYWYINSILQFPQFTCATWFAVVFINYILISTNKKPVKLKYWVNYLPERD